MERNSYEAENITRAMHVKLCRYYLVFLIILSVCIAGGAAWPAENKAPVLAVDAVGMTVSDMDRSVDFYSKVLDFQKISDTEVLGDDYEHLTGHIRTQDEGRAHAARGRND